MKAVAAALALIFVASASLSAWGQAADARPGGGAGFAGLRFIDGPKVVGVLKPSGASARAGAPLGFFVLRLSGGEVYEGVYNLKDDGRSLLGVFWPEGLIKTGDAAGYLELALNPSGAAEGAVSLLSGEEHPVTAR